MICDICACTHRDRSPVRANVLATSSEQQGGRYGEIPTDLEEDDHEHYIIVSSTEEQEASRMEINYSHSEDELYTILVEIRLSAC